MNYYVLNSSINIALALLAVSILVGFLFMVILNGIKPKIGIFPMFMHLKYPIYYTVFELIFILVLIGLNSNSIIPYVLGGLLVVNMIVLIIWRPYPGAIHNITIVVEQGVVLVALGTYKYSHFTNLQDNNETIFTIAFFVILYS